MFANCTLCTTHFLQIVGVNGHLKVDFTARFGFVIIARKPRIFSRVSMFK